MKTKTVKDADGSERLVYLPDDCKEEKGFWKWLNDYLKGKSNKKHSRK